LLPLTSENVGAMARRLAAECGIVNRKSFFAVGG
jgi:hypothetical protein